LCRRASHAFVAGFGWVVAGFRRGADGGWLPDGLAGESFKETETGTGGRRVRPGGPSGLEHGAKDHGAGGSGRPRLVLLVRHGDTLQRRLLTQFRGAAIRSRGLGRGLARCPAAPAVRIRPRSPLSGPPASMMASTPLNLPLASIPAAL